MKYFLCCGSSSHQTSGEVHPSQPVLTGMSCLRRLLGPSLSLLHPIRVPHDPLSHGHLTRISFPCLRLSICLYPPMPLNRRRVSRWLNAGRHRQGTAVIPCNTIHEVILPAVLWDTAVSTLCVPGRHLGEHEDVDVRMRQSSHVWVSDRAAVAKLKNSWSLRPRLNKWTGLSTHGWSFKELVHMNCLAALWLQELCITSTHVFLFALSEVRSQAQALYLFVLVDQHEWFTLPWELKTLNLVALLEKHSFQALQLVV